MFSAYPGQPLVSHVPYVRDNADIYGTTCTPRFRVRTIETLGETNCELATQVGQSGRFKMRSDASDSLESNRVNTIVALVQ